MSESHTNPALVAAENYEKNLVTYTMRPFTAILLEHANPQLGERVVDVACGTGVVARQTAPRVGPAGTVVAVDVNPAMLAVARSLPAPDGAAIDWREGSALALPLPAGAFDLALCQHGLQFFPDRRAALREMNRVLRPVGRVAVSVWRSLEHSPASRVIWESIARHLNTTTATLLPSFNLGDAGELRALLESAGFAEVTVIARSYTVREPRRPQFIARSLASVAGIVPAYAAMGMDERSALAQAVEVDSFLPLTPAVFSILLAMAGGEKHGYAIMQDIAQSSAGALRLGPGTLYRSIKQMLAAGLIEESGDRPDPALDDERRRYYRLGAFGRRVLTAEAERLARLVSQARTHGLLGDHLLPRAGRAQ